jgi:hypothetical protein
MAAHQRIEERTSREGSEARRQELRGKLTIQHSQIIWHSFDSI